MGFFERFWRGEREDRRGREEEPKRCPTCGLLLSEGDHSECETQEISIESIEGTKGRSFEEREKEEKELTEERKQEAIRKVQERKKQELEQRE